MKTILHAPLYIMLAKSPNVAQLEVLDDRWDSTAWFTIGASASDTLLLHLVWLKTVLWPYCSLSNTLVNLHIQGDGLIKITHCH